MKWETMDKINSLLSGYNHNSYWKMRFALYRTNLLKPIRYLFLFRCKRMEAKNCAALGIRLNGGSFFADKPILPHGIKGIFIAPYAKIGKNVTIYHQVSIAIRYPNDKIAPCIGDNVLIGAGAKIIGPIKVGNNVKIGANAVVAKDVPDNCTVVGNPAKIIPNHQNI